MSISGFPYGQLPEQPQDDDTTALPPDLAALVVVVERLADTYARLNEQADADLEHMREVFAGLASVRQDLHDTRELRELALGE